VRPCCRPQASSSRTRGRCRPRQQHRCTELCLDLSQAEVLSDYLAKHLRSAVGDLRVHRPTSPVRAGSVTLAAWGRLRHCSWRVRLPLCSIRLPPFRAPTPRAAVLVSASSGSGTSAAKSPVKPRSFNAVPLPASAWPRCIVSPRPGAPDEAKAPDPGPFPFGGRRSPRRPIN
jgi:hypothetical protein